MIIPVYIQIYYFLTAFAGGLLVGGLIHLYIITFSIKRPNKILAAFSDVLFWIFCSLSLFVFLLYTNNGNVGYYTFIGLGIGYYIYKKCFFKLLDKIFRGISLGTMKFIRVVLTLLKYPVKCVKYLVKYISYYIKKLFSIFRKVYNG